MANYTLQTYYNQGLQGGAAAPAPANPQFSRMARVPRQTVIASPRKAAFVPNDQPDPRYPWWIPRKTPVIPGTPFAPSGNDRVNAWLAAGGQFTPSVDPPAIAPMNPRPWQAGAGAVSQLSPLSSLYGGFIPAPFAASNAPYVPPSLPGLPIGAPAIGATPPRYGFDNRTTLYG